MKKRNALPRMNPPQGLGDRIVKIIRIKEIRSARMYFAWMCAAAAASFAGSLVSAIYIMDKLQTSGFVEYVSLMFSDSGAIMTYWREFTFSLVASLPLLGCVGLLAAVGALIWSMWASMKTYRSAEMTASHI